MPAQTKDIASPGSTLPAPEVAGTSSPRADRKSTTLAGFDFGTNKSCVLAGPAGGNDITLSKIVPTVVGYAKEGVVEGIITNNATILFGDDALRHMLHLNLIAPLEHGIVAHREAAKDFILHLRSLLDP